VDCVPDRTQMDILYGLSFLFKCDTCLVVVTVQASVILATHGISSGRGSEVRAVQHTSWLANDTLHLHFLSRCKKTCYSLDVRSRDDHRDTPPIKMSDMHAQHRARLDRHLPVLLSMRKHHEGQYPHFYKMPDICRSPIM
jgi:hypothetical protein